MLGSMLLAGIGPWIVPFPIALILIEFKIRIEERFMTAEFPEDYPHYRKRVPGLRPVTGHRAMADGSTGC
jgi:protein-S-isoprenylcysteine O-methyltransferase Ste14